MPLTEAAAGLLGSVGSAMFNAASQAHNNAVNREQSEYAFRREQDAVRRMNEYNSPSQQVVRLMAAGLNPSLAYGADGGLLGQQSDVPAYNPIPSESPKFSDVGAAARDAARLGLETREQQNRDNLAIAEKALKDSQSFLAYTGGYMNEAQTEETLTLLGYKVKDYENKFVLDEASYQRTLQDIEESKSRVYLNDKQIDELDSMIKLNNVRAHEILALLPANLAKLDAETLAANALSGLYTAEISEVAEKCFTLQYGRQLDEWRAKMDKAKFDRESHQYKVEYEKWRAEMQLNIRQNHQRNVTDVLRTVVGAGTVAAGASASRILSQEPPRTVVRGLGQ